MRYSKPEIQNESKATTLIMSGSNAKTTGQHEISQPSKRTEPPAYEADK